VNKVAQYSLTAGIVLAGGLLIFKLYKTIKKSIEIDAEKSKAEEEKRKKAEERFEDGKLNFSQKYTDSAIAKVSLNNDKILDVETKSYLYDKLSALKCDVLACDFDDYDEYCKKGEEFENIYNALDILEGNALEARILSLKKEDKRQQEHISKINKLREDERKHKQEMEKINATHEAELDIYEAKFKLEKAKFDTMCKALQNADNKNVQSTFNIKTNISED